MCVGGGENNPENRLVQACLWPNQEAVTGSIYIFTFKGLPGFCLLGCFEKKDFLVLDHLHLGDLLHRGKRKLTFLCTFLMPMFYPNMLAIMLFFFSFLIRPPL